MAGLVTGVIPILQNAVDTTTSYKCRSLWLGFLGIRLVILYLAEHPFSHLAVDFSCNSTSDAACVSACFNEHFDKPMVLAWNFFGLLFVLSVLIMDFFTSHLRSLSLKKSPQAKKDVELESQATGKSVVSPIFTKSSNVIDLHKHRDMVAFYLFSMFLRILVEGCFLYVLFSWNLPVVEDKFHRCKSNVCSEALVCVVQATSEKRTSIYILASISGLIVISSVIFCIYAVVHYICNC